MHPNCLLIGPHVKIGKNCIMAHQIIITPSPFYNAEATRSGKGPTIGDNVILGAGACVIGEIHIGNNVQISMNASVDNSFPDNSILFGVPARNISKPSKAEGST